MAALEPSLRRGIAELGHQLAAKKLVESTYGSISALLDTDIVICTPSGAAKGSLTRDRLVKVFLRSGKQLGSGKPTSSLPLHKTIYRTQQAAAIVHGQPSAVVQLLQAVTAPLEKGASTLIALGQEKVLVVGGACSNQAARALENCNDKVAAVFVHGLGLFTWGANLEEALMQLTWLESAATSAHTTESQPVQGDLASLVRQIAQNVTAALNTSPVPNAAPKPNAFQLTPVAQAATVVTTAPAVAGATQAEHNSTHSGCGSHAAKGTSCTGCGRCTNSGGVLPSAQQQAVQDVLSKLSPGELAAIVAEAAREVLSEKGLI